MRHRVARRILPAKRPRQSCPRPTKWLIEVAPVIQDSVRPVRGLAADVFGIDSEGSPGVPASPRKLACCRAASARGPSDATGSCPKRSIRDLGRESGSAEAGALRSLHRMGRRWLPRSGSTCRSAALPGVLPPGCRKWLVERKEMLPKRTQSMTSMVPGARSLDIAGMIAILRKQRRTGLSQAKADMLPCERCVRHFAQQRCATTDGSAGRPAIYLQCRAAVGALHNLESVAKMQRGSTNGRTQRRARMPFCCRPRRRRVRKMTRVKGTKRCSRGGSAVKPSSGPLKMKLTISWLLPDWRRVARSGRPSSGVGGQPRGAGGARPVPPSRGGGGRIPARKPSRFAPGVRRW